MPTGLYQYEPEKGIPYARMYALYADVPAEKRLFFYARDELDCANFASQCIWASYGGWIEGDSPAIIEQNRKRIADYVRQVPDVWNGSATFPGTPRWSRVEALFAYLVSNQSTGPRGIKTAEGTWNTVAPGMIQTGNIIQLVVTGYADYRYGHNLYVTQQGPTFDDILICCHSYDRLDAPLSSFSEHPDMYPKLRVIRLKDASFDR